MASERSRRRLVARLRAVEAASERVLNAMEQVPRHSFVDEAMASRAYDDTALPIGHAQTISQPFVVARMTDLLLDGRQMDTVLEVGTGSGYQAAVLSRLVRTVYTVERIQSLQKRTRRRLRQLGYANVRCRLADGTVGLPDYGPFDGILVTAGAQDVPEELIWQLCEGGRMVLPVGGHEQQRIVVIVRTANNHFDRQDLDAVSFVPLLPDLVDD